MPRSITLDKTWSGRYCPACNSPEAKLLFNKHDVPFVECDRCRTVYVNPAPPAALLSSLYESLGTAYFTNQTKLALDFDSNRYWRELAAIPRHMRSGRLLDVGCATGSFLLRAQNSGFADVQGIDISEPSVAYANKQIGQPVAIAGNFLQQPYSADHFDVVTLWATLEHVLEAEGFLREAYRILKPGGLVCVSVPNRDGISMRLLGSRYHMVGLEHLNYFTPASLKMLLQRVGFVVQICRTCGFNPLIFWKDLRGRHLSGRFSQSDLLQDQQQNADLRKNPVIRFLQKMADLVVAPIRAGDLLIMTAQK